MSKIKSLLTRLKISLIKKFIVAKYYIINFLGSFIPNIKNMQYTEEDILKRFDNIIIPFINQHQDFKIKEHHLPQIQYFDYKSKSCSICYLIEYETKEHKIIDFELYIKSSSENTSFLLNDKSKEDEILDLYYELHDIPEKDLFSENMRLVKSTKN